MVREKGFILLDVVFALFILTLGFGALYGLTEGATSETQQVANLTEASKLAQDLIEEVLAHSLTDNLDQGRIVLEDQTSGKKGFFKWTIASKWEIPNQLLNIQVGVYWEEKRKARNYTLDTLLAVP